MPRHHRQHLLPRMKSTANSPTQNESIARNRQTYRSIADILVSMIRQPSAPAVLSVVQTVPQRVGTTAVRVRVWRGCMLLKPERLRECRLRRGRQRTGGAHYAEADARAPVFREYTAHLCRRKTRGGWPRQHRVRENHGDGTRERYDEFQSIPAAINKEQSRCVVGLDRLRSTILTLLLIRIGATAGPRP